MNRVVAALSSIGGVLRKAQLRRVELAWGASIVAEWANFVALGVFAYHVGGTLAVGIAGLVRLLPAALVAPFAAFVGDRFRRERFLVAISAGGCLALAGSAAVYFLDRNEYVIFPLASLFGLSSTLLRPALQALLPSLARTPEELIASNGAASTIEGLATLVGPLAAGVLIAATDPGAVFTFAAVALLAAALLFARVSVEGRMLTAAATSAGSLRRALLAGFNMVLRSREPRLVAGLMLAQKFVRGCLNVLIVVTAFRVLTRVPLLPFDKFRNADKIARVSCPVLVMHGMQDEVVPFAHGRRLFGAAPEPKRFLWVDGAGHNDFMLVAGDRQAQALREFAALLRQSQAAGGT